MIAVLKIIHFLSFSVGAGVSIANLVIGARLSKAESRTAMEMGRIQGSLGKIGMFALLFVWITGVWMFGVIYGGSFGSLGYAFQLKTISVVLLTVAILAIHIVVARARRAGGAPPEKPLAALGVFVTAVTFFAIVFAVTAFSG
ncbi:MAG: hypothetical protein O7A03_03035 [Alphaproteobacteria bacterium]|nr:hypothetical protein [Alphaproteobacteria bacterium]